MKKLIALLLVLVLSCTLFGCGTAQSDEEVSSETEEETTVDEETVTPEETVGLANPWIEYESLEELNETLQCGFTKPGTMSVTDEIYQSCDLTDYTIGEYQFYVNGTKYVQRFCVSYDPDITGIYSAGVTADLEIDVPKLFEDVDCWAVKWATIDGQYTLCVFDESMDKETFVAIYEEMEQLTLDNSFAKNGD